MADEVLIQSLVEYFYRNKFQWKDGDEWFYPSRDQIEEALDLLRERLYDEPDGTSITMGRFTVHKNAGHFDLYTYQGEI